MASELKKLSKKFEKIAAKKVLVSKDVNELRQIRESIKSFLDCLKECQICGKAVDDIVKMEAAGKKASLCRECGIKALRDKSLLSSKVPAAKKKKAPRAESSVPAKKKSVKKNRKPETPEVKTPAENDDGLDELGKKNGISVSNLKKIRSIANNSAFLMPLNATISYVRSELRNTRIRVPEEKIESVVREMAGKHGLKVKA
ncbi:MAG: hypothetical protein ACLFQK_05935 [Fibrobacterota bacterium]